MWTSGYFPSKRNQGCSNGSGHVNGWDSIIGGRKHYVFKWVDISRKENVFRLDIERHHFDEKSPIFRYLCDNNAGEIYVGDICDGTGYTGEVWHDAYKFGLDSKILYTKDEKGMPVVIEPPKENVFSVPDRFGFRVTVKTPNKPDKDYAFFYGISAFSKWTYLKYHADKDQEVLHSLEPNYKKFLYYDEVDSFEKYPELVKAYPECYSREGFLDLENYGRKESSNLKR